MDDVLQSDMPCLVYMNCPPVELVTEVCVGDIYKVFVMALSPVPTTGA